MKYQHFHPPGASFWSTYNKILTFLFSEGHFYYTYTEISTFSPSRNAFLRYVYWNIKICSGNTQGSRQKLSPPVFATGRQPASIDFPRARSGGLSPRSFLSQTGIPARISPRSATAAIGAPFRSPEVTFTTRIMKYQHFHPRGAPSRSTYNEILTFLVSGGYFYYTYNEIWTFPPSQSVFLFYA